METQEIGLGCLVTLRGVADGIRKDPSLARQASRQGESTPAGRLKQLMEAVVERENMFKALRQVEANKGSAGVDGVSVDSPQGQPSRTLAAHQRRTA